MTSWTLLIPRSLPSQNHELRRLAPLPQGVTMKVRRHEIAGQRFGRLVAVSRVTDKRGSWLCRCDCGGAKVSRAAHLTTGAIQSCGCIQRERRLRGVATGRNFGGKNSPTPAYATWNTMKQRCLNPRNPNYGSYGGRGITICERWLTFDGFPADMGERPNGKTLDRIDVNGHYEPSNCRWASDLDQRRNTTRMVLEPHEPIQIRWLHGLGIRLCDIARFFEVRHAVVSGVVHGRTWVAP